MGMSDDLRQYVEETTKRIVDRPNDVSVQSTITTKAVIVQIAVHKSDCGKIIGKKGRTIEALKTLALAIKNTNHPDDSRRIMIEVLEDENSDFCYNR
jgi:hypothetical protein